MSEPRNTKGPGYPHWCMDCGKIAVVPAEIPYQTAIKFDGIMHSIAIEKLSVVRCSECGSHYFTNASGDQISNALRTKVGVLHPEEIAQKLEELHLTPPEFAAQLGVTAETVERWLDRLEMQTRLHDNLLRSYFTFPGVRELLANQQLFSAQPNAAPAAQTPVTA